MKGLLVNTTQGHQWIQSAWQKMKPFLENGGRLVVEIKELGNGVGHIVPNLTGTGIVQLNISTRKFTKQQASDFTEWLFVWCAENGVDLDTKGEIT